MIRLTLELVKALVKQPLFWIIVTLVLIAEFYRP